jgi:hypothetical protein
MKKNLFVTIIILLTSCASPTTPAPTQDLQPLIETIVIATLQAIPTSTPIPTLAPLPPTETPIPPTPTATATLVLPTTTSVPGDPALSLGLPWYVDSFNGSQSWTLFDTDCFKSEVKDGLYVMTDKGNISYACWEVTAVKVKNFYLQTSVIMPETCQSNDRFGMLFRAPDVDQGYLMGITCDGRFYLEKWDGEKTKVMVPPGSNPAIAVGAGKANRIGVMADGDTYTLYANGILLGTATDDQYQGDGLIGYFVAAGAKEPFTVKFDDLTVWKLP